ncbi:MAG TPA: SIMPL domain-containing protein [Kineosporiaceae bacterium]
MMTITPLRVAMAAAGAALAVAAVGLAAGYAWGSGGSAGGAAVDGLSTSAMGGLSKGGGGVAVRPAVALPAALGASSASSGPAGVAAAAGITVSGTGRVSGVPDTLNLSMGVSVTAATVTAALDGANTAAGKVMAVLRQHGVADKDLQTSSLSVQAQYGDGAKPVVNGYQVTESLTAVLRDLKGAGAVITAAAQAGGDATRVDAVSLDRSDTGPLVSEARIKAFGQAKEKAAQYARAAGVALGGVLSISEVVNAPLPVYDAAPLPTAAAAKAVPIAPGSAEIGVTVTVVFALG